eukprot:10592703-Ditylum_brightwellii.AAC.1
MIGSVMRTGSYSSWSSVVMIGYLSSLLVVMVSGDDGGLITAEEVAVRDEDTVMFLCNEDGDDSLLLFDVGDDGNEERV